MRVGVFGSAGMVGGAIKRALGNQASIEAIGFDRKSVNLIDQKACAEFILSQDLDAVVLAAAKVGGIYQNKSQPVDFLYENLMIQCNVIEACHRNNVDRVLFLGSSCIYPKFAPQPIHECHLLTGELEPTNSAYALAKISGLKLCEAMRQQYGRDYRVLMPCNVFGIGDAYKGNDAHVIPALIQKLHIAKLRGEPSVDIWGTGDPLREFIFSEDLGAICRAVLTADSDTFYAATEGRSFMNAGSGIEIT